MFLFEAIIILVIIICSIRTILIAIGGARLYVHGVQIFLETKKENDYIIIIINNFTMYNVYIYIIFNKFNWSI